MAGMNINWMYLTINIQVHNSNSFNISILRINNNTTSKISNPGDCLYAGLKDYVPPIRILSESIIDVIIYNSTYEYRQNYILIR